MVIEKGQIYWVDFGAAREHEPAYRRPAVVVQSDRFNRSAIGSVMMAPITSNLALAKAPGNVLLSARTSGLPRDSVVVVSQTVAIDKRRLEQLIAAVDANTLFLIDNGIRLLFDV
jgi:mRNA interferase MazF